jgi:hypothetical protein
MSSVQQTGQASHFEEIRELQQELHWRNILFGGGSTTKSTKQIMATVQASCDFVVALQRVASDQTMILLLPYKGWPGGVISFCPTRMANEQTRILLLPYKDGH